MRPIKGTEHYHSVDFGDHNSFREWGLYLEEPVIVSPPVPKTYLVSVPGRNGSLDLTEALGGISYEDRELEFHFVCQARRPRWPEIHRQILNEIHGRRMQIVLSDDPEYYYEGRVFVSDWDTRADECMEFPTITATVGPFKMERYLTEGTAKQETARIRVYGDNVSNIDWITDLRFGSQKISTFDFSLYRSIYITFTPTMSYGYITFTDGSGAEYSWSGTSTTWASPLTFTVSDLEANGLDASTIWRIYVAEGSNVKVYVYPKAEDTMVLTVQGGTWNSEPILTSNSYVTGVAYNGEHFSLSSGDHAVEGLQLTEGDNTLVFDCTSVNAEASITFRRGWL